MTRCRRPTAEVAAVLLVLLAAGCRGERATPPPAAAGAPPADTATAAAAPDSAAAVVIGPDSGPAIIMVLDNVDGQDGHFGPIALVVDGALAEVPSGEEGDSAVAVFDRRWFGAGQRYRVYQSGRLIGSAAAGEASILGCVGTEAAARVDSAPSLHREAAAIATSSRSIASLSADRRVLTVDERIALQRLAGPLIPDSVPARLRRLQLTFSTALRLSDQPDPALFALFTAADSDSTFELFVVAERVGRDYIATWHRTSFAATEDGGTHTTFVDVFDWNGDGILEFVLMNGYYESHDYSIVGRDGTGWRILYTGGGGGC